MVVVVIVIIVLVVSLLHLHLSLVLSARFRFVGSKEGFVIPQHTISMVASLSACHLVSLTSTGDVLLDLSASMHVDASQVYTRAILTRATLTTAPQ